MTTNPTITYETVRALGPELPALVGPADWPAVAAELDALHAAWAAAEAFRPMSPEEEKDARLAAWEAVKGKGEIWWNPPPQLG